MTKNINRDQCARKVTTFFEQPRGLLEFVHLKILILPDTERTPAQILKQFRQEYEPGNFFATNESMIYE